jgi:hypothetical protein
MLGGAVQTINVPVAWLRRYGTDAALYLAMHVSYAGSQSDPDGYQYNSALEIYEKTGIAPHRQKRIRDYLVSLSVIKANKGGIGNKWRVCPNIPLIELIDELERGEREVIEDARCGEACAQGVKAETQAGFEDSPQSALKTVPKPLSIQSQNRFEDSVQTHNRISTEKLQRINHPNGLEPISETARSLVVKDGEGKDGDEERRRRD